MAKAIAANTRRKLYFERLREFSEEMERRGVKRDERLYRNLLKLARTSPSSRHKRARPRGAVVEH